MFEEFKLLGTTERSIVVQTRKGTPIDNLVEIEPGELELRRYQLFLRKFGQNWKERKPAVGVYNCAGHVWASRRTSILADDVWQIILREDGYRSLSGTELPVAGDLVLYVDGDNGKYLHVGMILELVDGVTRESRKIPKVLSKLNSAFGEVVHNERDVPYDKQGISAKIEYWTDRPAM
jgi:hypothetical protein